MPIELIFKAYTPFIANLGLLSLLAWVLAFKANRLLIPKKSEVLKQSILIGILLGCATIMLMLIPFKLETGIFADSRGIPLLISGLLGGPIASCITILFALMTRYTMGGAGAISGMLYILIFGAVGLLLYFTRSRYLRKTTFEYKRLIFITLLTTTASVPVIFLLPEGKQIPALLNVWPQIYLANVIGMYVLASLIHYVH